MLLDLVTRDMELRKLSYHQLHVLASHLNQHRDWSKLMATIPKDLSKLNLDTTVLNFKYTTNHIQMIEEASQMDRSRKLPGHILFEEWGTSGRVRPTLANLLQLLVQASLFRAADYLADILHEEPPARPSNGPAAPIDFTAFLDESGDNLNFDSEASTLTTTNNNVEMNDSWSTGVVPVISELFPNGAIVTADEASNAPTLSTNVQSDPILDGLTDVELPNLSMLMNVAANTGVETHFERQLTTMNSESVNETSMVHQSVSASMDSAAFFQSGVPNVSLFGGMHVAEETLVETTASTTTSSGSTSSSSTINLPSVETPEQSFSNTNQSFSSTNQSLPQLSFLMNNIQMASTSFNGVPETETESIPYSSVQQFSFSHLTNCTNNFNGDDFTSLSLPGRKLGAGGFGSVHLGINLAPLIPVAAVKRLHKNFGQVGQKFDLEIQILSQHQHENLVQLLGYSDDCAEMCLIYEFVSGGNLERRLELCRSNEGKLPIHRRLGVALGVAKGIDYLHAAKLIHRDVKSANVLLTEEDTPKLCDFGLLRQLNSRTTTMAVGSSGYMAPEVVRGTYDYEKVDIFAFGVLQLELLTGLPVICEERREDLVTHVEKVVGEGDITPLLDSRAGDWLDLGKRWYEEIVMKALELSPNRRSDIVECLRRLEELCNT